MKSKEFKKKLFRKKPTVVKDYKAVKCKKEVMDNVKKSIICHERKLDESRASLAEAKSSVLGRANEVQAKLPSQFPSLVKSMLRSHVTYGFWLGLPSRFCDSHLPKRDGPIFLVDGEKEHETKYLAEKKGLSAGWRGFSIEHKLREGDAVVFQLIKPCRFKVYIVRANRLTETDGAISLLNLDVQAKSNHNAQIKNQIEEVETARQKTLEPPGENSHQDDIQKKRALALNFDPLPGLEQSGNESDDFAEVLHGITFSESIFEFKDVKGFENFRILVDGLVIDSEIPIHLRTKYYVLCCSQNSFLHDHLVKGLNCQLAAGIISETVNIADAIRASKLTTSCDYLQTWDRTLKAFEDMGMQVGFLRERLRKLVYLSNEQQEVIDSKKLERAQVEEEMQNLASKISDVKEVIRALDAEIRALVEKKQLLGLTFKDIAAAPW